MPTETAELNKENYRPTNHVAYQATTAAPGEPLGCDVARLPAARDGWLALTYDRFTPPPYDLPSGGDPPDHHQARLLQPAGVYRMLNLGQGRQGGSRNRCLGRWRYGWW